MTKWESEIHNFTIKHIKGKELLVLVYKEVRIVEKQSKNKDSDKGGGEKKMSWRRWVSDGAKQRRRITGRI